MEASHQAAMDKAEMQLEQAVAENAAAVRSAIQVAL